MGWFAPAFKFVIPPAQLTLPLRLDRSSICGTASSFNVQPPTPNFDFRLILMTTIHSEHLYRVGDEDCESIYYRMSTLMNLLTLFVATEGTPELSRESKTAPMVAQPPWTGGRDLGASTV